jgi:hypothetical protein
MCVFEKNYRLQDIQLSKIPPAPFGFGEADTRVRQSWWRIPGSNR